MVTVQSRHDGYLTGDWWRHFWVGFKSMLIQRHPGWRLWWRALTGRQRWEGGFTSWPPRSTGASVALVHSLGLVEQTLVASMILLLGELSITGASYILVLGGDLWPMPRFVGGFGIVNRGQPKVIMALPKDFLSTIKRPQSKEND